jgi:nucleoside 2-deoxyribosyltransferase
MQVQKKLIYIAGPLFTIQDRDYLLKIRDVVRLYGADTFLPQEDNDDNAEGRGDGTSRQRLHNIFKNDYEAIEKAHAMIALLDGVPLDCGTTWEIGFAFAKSKPILGLRSDFRIIGNFANQKVDLMSEAACTKILFSPEGDFSVIGKGITDFLKEINV